MFTTFHMGHYIPLTWLTFGLDYAVWGMDPFGYHLTSLLLHAANAVLVYLIAVRLLSQALPSLAKEWLGLRLTAITAALLFALHPLRVESVAWATERRDVLCGFFYLLAILAYLRACEARTAWARGGRLWYGAAVAAFAASLLSKSMAVSLPVMLLLLDIYPLRRLTPDRAILKEPRQRLVLAEKIPFVMLSLAAAVAAIVAVRHGARFAPLSELGIAERLSIASLSLSFYLWKMLAPFNLSPLYEMPDSIRWWWPVFIPGWLVVIAVTSLAVGLRRRCPALAAVWASYIVILLPVSGIAHNGPQITADRYSYLSCLGWALLAAGGLGWSWLRLRRTQPVSSPARGTLLVILILTACLGGLTWRQVKIWHDTEALWTHALRVSPSAQAHQEIAMLLEERGRRSEAVAHYEQALRTKPSYGPAHISLGLALTDQGRFEEAISHYKEAARLTPELPVPYFNLGVALAAQGRTAEAIERYREALKLLPAYSDAHNNLGMALLQQGRLGEAAEHFREMLKLRPDDARAHGNLGTVLVKQGRPAEALEEFREAVRLRPADAPGRFNLGTMLAGLGRLDEAAAQFREALRLNPGLREAQKGLDGVLTRLGRSSR
jgi:protein O-mannosyl-transferase